jgi:hypothetical protein
MDASCGGHDGTTSGQACAVRLCEGRPETVVVAANAAWAASDVGALAQDILAELLGSGSLCPAETRPDALAGYDAWRIPTKRDPSGCYARLNATTLARLGSQGKLEIEEIYSPQDEANWFGKKNPQATERIASRLHRAKGHSYMSASKEFHFLRHPDDADRLYLHDGMRASVKTHRPWW